MLYHGEHGRLQGTQGTHKYYLVFGAILDYLVFGARPCYIMENMDAYKELKAHTSTY